MNSRNVMPAFFRIAFALIAVQMGIVDVVAAEPRLNVVVTSESAQTRLVGKFRPIDGYLSRSPRVFRAVAADAHVTFLPQLALIGYYNVLAWWPHGVPSAGAISASIKDAAGVTTLSVDQSANGGQWISLGVFEATAKARIAVTLRGQRDSNLVVDAMRFHYVGRQPPEIVITPERMPAAELGVEFEVMLNASGRPPFAWSLVKGRLPEGLALDSARGLITGRALEPGEFSFEMEVVDAVRRRTTRTVDLAVLEGGAE